MQWIAVQDKPNKAECSHLMVESEDLAWKTQSTIFDNSAQLSQTRSLGHILRCMSIRQQLQRVGFFLLPTFVQYRLRPHIAPRPEKLHPTAYLDGIRGIAALLVFVFHLSYSCHDTWSAYGGGGKNHEFLKLPFVRFIWNGPSKVSIFYVVSGFALSYKPVKLMRSHAWTELTHNLSSSVFRRGLRLYLPVVASTLFIIFLVRVGAYEMTQQIANDPKKLPYHREWHTRRERTLWIQLRVWAQKMWDFIHPWSFGTGDTLNNIDGHTWSITMEFRASLILYLTHIFLARLRSTYRVIALILLIIWVHQKDRWEMILFYGGFLLAELEARRRDSPSHSSRPWSIVYILVFLLGIYLGGQPEKLVSHSPGWATLHSWIPNVHHPVRYWVNWGALMLVWSTSCSTYLQGLFTNEPVQYLGKISYSLYLMHGPMTHTIGYGIMDFMWTHVGRDTYFKKELGFGVAGIIDLIAIIWTADIFTRVVDTPSVNFARWFEDKCIVHL